jgi:nitroimidazol reductase NimA-like FMN-containing flavoprotein (pyridoxamine 5'-phosphate oxidase superfamily)
MSEMTKVEVRNFLLQGTFTGKLGTINKNGTPHIVPIWFTLDDENNIIFTTDDTSVKANEPRYSTGSEVCELILTQFCSSNCILILGCFIQKNNS